MDRLKTSDIIAPRPGPLVIVVMDGVGIGTREEDDAVKIARTPTLDMLRTSHPFLALRAHGTAVGLPSDDDMGNSEVGHNALGAGRVFAQGAKLVNAAIASGSIFEGATWQALTSRVRERGSALHFLGLLSDGNVHSHQDHLEAMIARADAEGIERVFVHALLDGRDVPETSALEYIDRLEAFLSPLAAKSDRTYAIASGGGRMVITMDRYEADWGMVERGWKIHVHGDGPRFASARVAVETLREQNPGTIDQDLPPFVIGDAAPVGPIRDGDAVVFFNFRGDRALEISRAFEQDDFDHFDRGTRPDVMYAGMMEYDGDYHIPSHYLVEPPAIDRTMGEYLAREGITQFACSETQKYGHVTYFWNGNRGGMFDEKVERYLEIPSDRVSFDERPWMKAAEITDATIQAIASGEHRLLRINYANGDMVGHTGDLEATIQAVATVDLSLARLLKAVEKAEGVALITADHGNADEMYMWDKKKNAFRKNAEGFEARTSHSLNPVPFHLFDGSKKGDLSLRTDLASPGIASVASTTLELLGFVPPQGYVPSLLKR